MPPEVWVPLAVAVIGGGVALAGGQASRRAERRATAEQTSRETLDEVWQQRVTFRDEQIEELRKQVADLTTEVRRLNGIIEQLGGQP